MRLMMSPPAPQALMLFAGIAATGLGSSASAQTSFYFELFNSHPPTPNIRLVGDTKPIIPPPGPMVLTGGVPDQNGAMWYSGSKVYLRRGFSTTFSYVGYEHKDSDGGADGFERVLDLVDAACEGLLANLRSD